MKNKKKITTQKIPVDNLYGFYDYMNEVDYLYREWDMYLRKKAALDEHVNDLWKKVLKFISINMAIIGWLFVIGYFLLNEPSVIDFITKNGYYYEEYVRILSNNLVIGLICVFSAKPFYKKLMFWVEFYQLPYIDAIAELDKNINPVCQKMYEHFLNCPYKDVSGLFTYKYSHPVFANEAINFINDNPDMAVEDAVRLIIKKCGSK